MWEFAINIYARPSLITLVSHTKDDESMLALRRIDILDPGVKLYPSGSSAKWGAKILDLLRLELVKLVRFDGALSVFAEPDNKTDTRPMSGHLSIGRGGNTSVHGR